MILNPTTLRRVLDNEFLVPAGEDALTLPELLQTIVDASYGELDTKLNGSTFTDREPMITSLRRNLQASVAERLIYLATGDRRMPRAIRTLALHHLRSLNARIDKLLEKAEGGQVDPYTIAHLEDLSERISKAMDISYVQQF